MSEILPTDDKVDIPKVWELRHGELVLGILTENDWYQPPFRGYDFKSTPAYGKYSILFRELLELNNKSWEASLDAKGVPPQIKERIEEKLDALKGAIGSLKLTMHPIDRQAPDSRVVIIFIDKGKAQLIPDFERYNPFDYYEWSANS